MRRGLFFLGVAILAFPLAVPLSGASTPPGDLPSMTVSAAPRTAGAHRVRVAITLRYTMQCGYPGAGPLVVTFPSAAKLPKRFTTGSVKLAGKAIAAKIKRRNVTVTVPQHQGVLCGTIGPGSVTILFTRAGKLVNPAKAGSYGFTAAHGKHTFKAELAITPAG
jgi:hypothetical protein